MMRQRTRNPAVTEPDESGVATTLATPISPLEKARQKRREMAANGQSLARLDPVQKAAAHPTSLRMAITAKCWVCVGSGQDSNPRLTIGACTVKTCPLHPHRPYQHKAEDESEDE